MQHLREPGAPGAETYFVDDQTKFEYMASRGLIRHADIDLPEELLPSVEEEDIGLLARAAPHSGPRLDLDPDIVAALEDDEIAAPADDVDIAPVFEEFFGEVHTIS